MTRHCHVNLQRLNLRLFIRLQHTSVLFLFCFVFSKCTKHFVVRLLVLCVNYLKSKLIIKKMGR